MACIPQHDSLQTHIHHYNTLKNKKSLDLAPVMSGDAVDMCWVHSGAVCPLSGYVSPNLDRAQEKEGGVQIPDVKTTQPQGGQK